MRFKRKLSNWVPSKPLLSMPRMNLLMNTSQKVLRQMPTINIDTDLQHHLVDRCLQNGLLKLRHKKEQTQSLTAAQDEEMIRSELKEQHSRLIRTSKSSHLSESGVWEDLKK